ncbi:MAG: molecular chaperone TorD family protein [Eggerthellaceae bacterium]|nr:molecular chaperone TorD family protein [Eggerthellaceae bacterium]
MQRDAQFWNDAAEAFAFLGNSLLAPMNQTGTVGIEPSFWDAFPTYGDVCVAEAVDTCRTYAQAAQESAQASGDPVQDASVEYTHLFVGPPHPAAAPWETMYRPESEGATVGFGQATYEMRSLLRDAGLEVSNQNNQYADHIGIELLYASVLCDRAREVVSDDAEWSAAVSSLVSYLRSHPLVWVGKLRAAVDKEAKDGYISNLLKLAEALANVIAS